MRTLGAQIGGQLDCSGGSFTNEKDPALSAGRINVKGSVFLSSSDDADGNPVPFVAKGEVNLNGAQIDGKLDSSGGHFDNPDGDSLSANRATIKSSVLPQNGFFANGRVHLQGAQIGGDLSCYDVDFQNATLDLTDASAATLYDCGLEFSMVSRKRNGFFRLLKRHVISSR